MDCFHATRTRRGVGDTGGRPGAPEYATDVDGDGVAEQDCDNTNSARPSHDAGDDRTPCHREVALSIFIADILDRGRDNAVSLVKHAARGDAP